MKLEVVTSAKVIKCSFLLQCAKTFNSNPGNPIHTENPSLANQSSFGKENRFIKKFPWRRTESGKRSIHKGVSYGFRPSLFPRKLHMFMKYGPKVQTSFTTQSCTHQGLISKKNKSSAAVVVVIPKALELQINALYCGKISLGLALVPSWKFDLPLGARQSCPSIVLIIT